MGAILQVALDGVSCHLSSSRKRQGVLPLPISRCPSDDRVLGAWVPDANCSRVVQGGPRAGSLPGWEWVTKGHSGLLTGRYAVPGLLSTSAVCGHSHLPPYHNPLDGLCPKAHHNAFDICSCTSNQGVTSSLTVCVLSMLRTGDKAGHNGGLGAGSLQPFPGERQRDGITLGSWLVFVFLNHVL